MRERTLRVYANGKRADAMNCFTAFQSSHWWHKFKNNIKGNLNEVKWKFKG